MSISPEGYRITIEPKNKNPFWGEDSGIENITASASVDDTTGTPNVTVTRTETEDTVNFDFAFTGLKGADGQGGGGAADIDMTATVDDTTGTPGVTVTKTVEDDTTNFALAFTGLKGADGKDGTNGINGTDGTDGTDGVTPDITMSATVDNTTGTPAVTVTKSGTDEAPSFALAFTGLKGEDGQGGGGTADIDMTATVDDTTGTPGVTVTKTVEDDTTNFTLAFTGLKGEDGQDGTDGTDGATPDITVSATVDNTTGTPAVTVTKSGTDEAPSFALAFTGLKGEDGESPSGAYAPIVAGVNDWEEDTTYYYGNLVYYNGNIYRCEVVSTNEDYTNPEDDTNGLWSIYNYPINYISQDNVNNNGFALNIGKTIAPLWSGSASYVPGDVVCSIIYTHWEDDVLTPITLLYRCLVATDDTDILVNDTYYWEPITIVDLIEDSTPTIEDKFGSKINVSCADSSLYGQEIVMITDSTSTPTGVYTDSSTGTATFYTETTGSEVTFQITDADPVEVNMPYYGTYDVRFVAAGEVSLIPIMTSNTAPSGTASAVNAQTGYDAYKAFDGDDTTFWLSTQASAYVQYQFDAAVTATKALLYVASNNQTVEIQGSNDGSTWITVKESFTLAAGTQTEVELDSANSYSYFRFNITKLAGSTAWIHTIQLYGQRA